MDSMRLIAEIQNRPPLWSTNAAMELKNLRLCVPDMWKDVAASMGPNVTVDECKRKWKWLRNTYRKKSKRKELRIQRALQRGVYDPLINYGNWVYFESMSFLQDISNPGRKILNKHINSPSDQYSELYSIENIETEPLEIKLETISLCSNEEYDDRDNGNEIYNQQRFIAEEIQMAKLEDISQTTLNSGFDSNFSGQNSLQGPDDNALPTSCECPKWSYDQVHFLQDLAKEEQSLMESTSLDIERSNELFHSSDSDYNFLLSCLPQMKIMSKIQNLQFRAEVNDLILKILSQQ